jgi:hypothetical protein
MPHIRRKTAIGMCLALASVVLPTVAVQSPEASARPAGVTSAHAPRRARSFPSRARCTAAKRANAHRRRHKTRRHRIGRACAGRRPTATSERTQPTMQPSSSQPATGVASGTSSIQAAPQAAYEPSSPASKSSSTTSAPTPAPTEPPPSPEPAGPFRFFSPTSFWNEALSANAPLDPNSAAIMGFFNQAIAKEVEVKRSPSINTTAWSVPIYTVPADQPVVKVTLENASKAPALQAAWDAVPLPPKAQPATGTDKHLVAWQPSSDKLWEFWKLEDTTAGWQAAWGGAMEKALSDPGVYGPEAWPGATRWWGASATSLSIAGGLITLEDLEKGQINHALAMAIPSPRASVYASPAQRTDGWSAEPYSIPEGAHLRLDPKLDLASLKLPRSTLMLAEAAQRYGIFIRDTAGEPVFYAQDPTPTGTNPYTGASGYFEGKSPQQLLAAFPWSHLQLLKMELH